MKAIILAAGEGKRLHPLTLDRPKCLVEYQGKPIIDYQLEVLRSCGLREIVVVKGYLAESLQRPEVHFVVNPHYAQTNMVYTFFCAEKYFDDDLIVSYGDVLYEKSILETLLAEDADFAVAVSLNWRDLWQKRMQDPLLDAETLKMDEAGFLVELGKKARSYDDIQGQYMGLFKIKKPMVKTLQKTYQGLDRDSFYDGKSFPMMFMTSFIQRMIEEGYKVRAVPVTGQWLEVDRLEDLQVACQIL